jgi:hypothetical protein
MLPETLVFRVLLHTMYNSREARLIYLQGTCGYFGVIVKRSH